MANQKYCLQSYIVLSDVAALHHCKFDEFKATPKSKLLDPTVLDASGESLLIKYIFYAH